MEASLACAPAVAGMPPNTAAAPRNTNEWKSRIAALGAMYRTDYIGAEFARNVRASLRIV
jgi:hypothetical protein